MIEQALLRLDRYCRKERYRGWDIFDGLNSIVFQKSPFFRSRLARLAWLQFFKCSPLNLRRPAGVPKDYNAKGLGLFASGLITLNRMDEAESLLERLKGMTSHGFRGMSWGYNFPWQARAFYVPVGTPNMVTTVFAASAFLDWFERTGNGNALDTARASCDFILQHLVLHEEKERLCFGYIPGEGARVHNANMLGAEFLARVWKHTQETVLLDKSRKAMAYSMDALTEEYYWPYGERGHHRFIDNFHTGFNLVALKKWMASTGEVLWENELTLAYRQFLDSFWLEDGRPKYYHNSLYPIDIHCSAQGIVTCVQLNGLDDRSMPMAGKIAKWAIDHMQDQKGYFYCQKTRWFTNRIPYMRWTQAWMFYALAQFVLHSGEYTDTPTTP